MDVAGSGIRLRARRLGRWWRRSAVYWLPLAVLGVALCIRLAIPQFLDRLSVLAFDVYQREQPREADNLPLSVVDIDDRSLRAIGQWPWPRSVSAALVDKLREAGAAEIVFDVLYSEPDRTAPKSLLPLLTGAGVAPADAEKLLAGMPDPDETLARAMGKVPVVVGFALADSGGTGAPAMKTGFSFLGGVGMDPLSHVARYSQAIADRPVLQQAAAGDGFVNTYPDWDNVERKVPLILRLGDRAVPSLAAEALRVATGAHAYIARAAGASGDLSFGEDTGLDALKIGPLVVPTDGAGRVWLYYSKPRLDRYISAADIMSGHFDRRRIADRVVLIGASAISGNDLLATPMGVAVPGVEILAQTIAQILQGTYLARPAWMIGAEVMFTLVFGLVMIVAMPRTGALGGGVIGGVAVAVAIGVSWLAFRDRRLLVDPVYPIMVLTVVYLIATLLNHRRTERHQREVRQAFSRYLSPHFVAELARHPEKLVLGGEIKTMTIMFCDIRNFTAMSEGMSPSTLTHLMNGFLTPMTDIITAHQGTIDKYIGDCIMAFWNAPLDDPDHAKHAVAAAQAMRRRLAELNDSWQQEAVRDGVPRPLLRFGIGINTGECCVGNFGSQMRLNYSLMGDPVNLASRLESLGKLYGVDLIIGEETAALIDQSELVELDLVAVKGKTQAVHIYTLPPQPIVEVQFPAQHAALLAAYRRRDWATALGMLEDTTLAGVGTLRPVYELFRRRIAHLQSDAPPGDWDGVYVAEEK